MMRNFIRLVFFSFLFFSFFLKNYVLTFSLMSFILISELIFNKDLNVKIINGFLFVYFFIPFLNISNYRGSIDFDTMMIYCISNILIVLTLLFFSRNTIRSTQIIYINKNVNLYLIALSHIFISFVLTFFLYFKYGNVLLDQEIRFVVSPSIGYIIKSTIYIPLIFILLKTQKNFIYIFTFIVLPLLPAFLIGSRGTVIMIILGLLILLLIMQKEKSVSQNKINIKYQDIKFKHLFFGFSIATFILYAIFFVRRIGSKVYVTSSELVKQYFDVNIPISLIYIILPIYFNLRETVGITNNIIINNLSNTKIIPMFFMELFTILPGKQDAPGIVLGEMIGKVGDAGLTPGMIGGLYLDFGYLTILFPMFFISVICFFYRYSLSNDMFKIIYVLALIQFFHIYHRGFLKLEYIMAFMIVFVYLVFSGSFIFKK